MIMLKSVVLLLAMNALAAVVQPSRIPSNNPHDFPEVTYPPNLPKLSRDVCINFVASEFEKFQMGTEMNKLVEESRTHYPDSIKDLLEFKPNPEYKGAMERLADKIKCDAIFHLHFRLFHVPQCQEYYVDRKQFVDDTIALKPHVKNRIELYCACFYGFVKVLPPKGEDSGKGEGEGEGDGSGSGEGSGEGEGKCLCECEDEDEDECDDECECEFKDKKD